MKTIENMSLEEIEAIQKELEKVKEEKLKKEKDTAISKFTEILQQRLSQFKEYGIEIPSLENKDFNEAKKLTENAFSLLKENVIDLIISQLKKQKCDRFLTKELKEKYIKKLLEDKERKPEVYKDSIIGWTVDFQTTISTFLLEETLKKDVYGYYLSNHIFMKEEQAKKLLEEAISKIDFGIEVKTGEFMVSEESIGREITIVRSLIPVTQGYEGWIDIYRNYTDVYISVTLRPYFSLSCSKGLCIKRCEEIEISGGYDIKTKKWEWI